MLSKPEYAAVCVVVYGIVFMKIALIELKDILTRCRMQTDSRWCLISVEHSFSVVR